MKQTLKNVLFFSYIILFFVSCSTIKQNISKNNKYTSRLVFSILQANGNVFYLSSTYATFSTVWTYDGKGIEVYKLANGKISQKMTYENVGISNYEIPTDKELVLEAKQCGYELDGDIFGFRIRNGLETENQDLPLSIECLTKHKYKSGFLNKVVEDINVYKLWNVKYK